MGPSFVECDREQSFLLPPDVRDWLPEGHLAWFVIDAVEAMDLSAFYGHYRADGRSRPAYEPSVMVAVLLYAYARGIRSSRVIERACQEDVAFRVIAAHQQPDHATFARFIERHQDAMGDLFGEVLVLCAQAGLAKVGVIAVDGTKLQANASRNENLDYEQIAKRIIEEAIQTDAAEDELYGDARGDELPEELRTGEGRRAWLREAQKRLEEQRDRDPQPVPRDRPKRIKEAKRRLEEQLFTEVRANEAYEQYRATGRMKNGRRLGAHSPPKPYTPPEIPEGRINTTDPDSRVMKGLRGFIQGYNAQAVTNQQQIVIAAEVMTQGGDFGHLAPMLDHVARELDRAGIRDAPEIVLADAGYWHGEQMQALAADGIQVLIPPDTSKRKAPRAGWTGGRYDFMRAVLASDHGAVLYRQRQSMIEPVFGQMKFNRQMSRFKRRGRAAVRAEWKLITATHNLLKLHKHALATA